MSFSKDVKEELSRQSSSGRHCMLAELAAIISYGGRVVHKDGYSYLRLQTESIDVARKYFTLIKKTFNMNMDISLKVSTSNRKNSIYTLILKRSEDMGKVLQATKLWDDTTLEMKAVADNVIVQNTCCKRAFIRGAFLSSGSMSNPKKAYHLEVVLPDILKAEQLREILQSFSIDGKIVLRKKNYVVYVKESSQIVDLLNVMEGHVALMNLENVRILKEMRNSINRQVNCEAANITKTVNASSKQIEDIIFIQDRIGFGELDEGLKEMAQLRLEHPDASLKELGTMLLPPIGKSGVNHRLRKLSMIAEQLREHKEESKYDKERHSD